MYDKGLQSNMNIAYLETEIDTLILQKVFIY